MEYAPFSDGVPVQEKCVSEGTLDGMISTKRILFCAVEWVPGKGLTYFCEGEGSQWGAAQYAVPILKKMIAQCSSYWIKFIQELIPEEMRENGRQVTLEKFESAVTRYKACKKLVASW